MKKKKKTTLGVVVAFHLVQYEFFKKLKVRKNKYNKKKKP